jgi:integrase
MSIRIKGSKFLADFMFEGQRYRRSFPTDAEAREWEASLHKRLTLRQPCSDLLHGKGVSAMTLRDLMEATYQSEWKDTRNERHQLVNMRQLEHYFGHDLSISAIDTEAVDGFIRHLESRQLSPATINSRLSTLSKAINFGADRGYIINRPKIRRMKVGNNQRMRFLTDEEERDILEVLTGDGRTEFAQFFIWSLDTGMRPIEARHVPQTAVRWDKNMECYLVDLRRTKNSYPRTIPLTKRAYDAFMELTATGDPYPFARFTESNIRSNWKFIREALNDTDPEFVFYLTRHTCASRLVQRRIELYTVKEWMGHKTYEMTMRYAKLSPRNMLDAKTALEQIH